MVSVRPFPNRTAIVRVVPFRSSSVAAVTTTLGPFDSTTSATIRNRVRANAAASASPEYPLSRRTIETRPSRNQMAPSCSIDGPDFDKIKNESPAPLRVQQAPSLASASALVIPTSSICPPIVIESDRCCAVADVGRAGRTGVCAVVVVGVDSTAPMIATAFENEHTEFLVHCASECTNCIGWAITESLRLPATRRSARASPAGACWFRCTVARPPASPGRPSEDPRSALNWSLWFAMPAQSSES
jgi:hypothetical protein